MKLHPIAFYPTKGKSLAEALNKNPQKDTITEAAYRYLVTTHGVAPDEAKKLLGRENPA